MRFAAILFTTILLFSCSGCMGWFWGWERGESTAIQQPKEAPPPILQVARPVIKPDDPEKNLVITAPVDAETLKTANPVFKWRLNAAAEDIHHISINVFEDGWDKPSLMVFDDKGFLDGSYEPGRPPEGLREKWGGRLAGKRTFITGQAYTFRLLVVTQNSSLSDEVVFQIKQANLLGNEK